MDKIVETLKKITDKMKADKDKKETIKEKHTDKGKMTDAQFLKYLRELHGIK